MANPWAPSAMGPPGVSAKTKFSAPPVKAAWSPPPALISGAPLASGWGISVVLQMPYWFIRTILVSGFGLATLVLGFDRQSWITVFAALLLALIILFTNDAHVDLLGAASVDLPQQAGIQRSI
jgi:hypothetical protein